jgi:uncharacterized DUF497 family protein
LQKQHPFTLGTICAISIFDEGHSNDEERWVTIGKDRHDSLLVLVHTFSEMTVEECAIRIISAWKAKKQESKQYEEI